MEAARVPEHVIKKSRPLLKDMLVGETWHVVFTDVVVIDGRAYLDPEAQRREAGLMTVMLRRDEKGFHVVVKDPRTLFISTARRTSDLIPVSLTEEYSGNAAA